jgi:sigma-B regulation protein RsbU (phosphoserine phosphatase)
VSLKAFIERDRLTQVVSNLLGNAIQHGAGTPITVGVRGEGETVVLDVHNSGQPIPPDVEQSIFEPLYRRRPDGADRAGSIGLGLFIARAIVTGHGGEIHVRSSADLGTTFTVMLPRGAPAPG